MSSRLTSVKALAALSVVLAAVVIAAVLREYDGVQALDQAVLSYLDLRSPAIYYFSYTASLEAFAAVTAIAYFLDVGLHRSASRRLVSFAVAIILSMIVTALLKAYVMEPRPHEPLIYFGLLGNLVNADYYGFPSGHTVRVTVLAYYMMTTPSTRRKGLGYAASAYAIAIMVSRLLLQVHWLWDIVGGVVVGLWSCSLVDGVGERAWVYIYNRTFGLARPLRLRPN
ncbi:phosphatase PAP2 family protein [Acidilobus sp. 7A]|uniref:phosphatase PAP2 family protein n=1 Tax=Acidilobus sp. 7A TaxID=1577685 RepID=UPI000E3DF215|nr:phosphatase PAP2 family protein [Acidilobus sp. 7A]